MRDNRLTEWVVKADQPGGVLERGRAVSDLNQLKDFVISAFKELFEIESASSGALAVFLHGSRAEGTNRPTSDVDVAVVVFDSRLLEGAELAALLIREAVEESFLPYELDLVVVEAKPENEFVKRVLKGGLRWL